MIGRTIGRFVVIEKLGEGGMATVWKARDSLLDRSVALKVIIPALSEDPDVRRRFHHEAEVATRLDHPGIASVYGSGSEDGVTYLAMACIDGETLDARLARGLMPLTAAIDMIRAAADALGFAHDQGVVHRDVTSRNIMLARDGRVFVLDFGLAKATGVSRITSRNTMVGTVAYMAPELFMGRDADACSDLYGLGVVFYEALTGSLPFDADSPEVLRYAALNQNPRPPRERRPEISAALERVVLKAMAREPEQRHHTTREFLDDLGSVAEFASRDEHPPAASPAARVVAERSVVHLGVLPIRWNEHSEELDATGRQFAADLEAALRDSLARAGRIHVVPGSGPAPDGDSMTGLRAFARSIGAHVLLRGSLRRRGSLLRFGYALVDPEAGLQIGGGSLSGSLAETFDFEDRIIAHVCDQLGREQVRAERKGHRSKDPAAEHRYAQALACLRRYDSEASVDGAIRLLEDAIETGTGTALHHATLVRAALRKHEYTQLPLWEGRAAMACQRALELAPELPEVQLAVGELKRATGQHDAAMAAFEIALASASTCHDAMLGIARTHAEAGRMAEAEAAARSAIADQPKDWRGHNLMGWIHIQNGHHDRAVDSQLRVLELTPDNARGLSNLGTAYYRLNDFDRAIDAYRRSLEIQPSHIRGYTNLGTALYFDHQHQPAIEALRKATVIAPSDPHLWGNLGNACHWVSGYEDEARTALDRAIGLMRERLERTPGVAQWWAELGGWLSNRGQLQEAERVIQRALELAPNDGSVMMLAAHVYRGIGDRKACYHWLRAARDAGYGFGEFARSIELAPLREDPELMQFIQNVSPPPANGARVTEAKSVDPQGGRT